MPTDRSSPRAADEKAVAVSGLAAAGQWLIVIGAAMVAMALTSNYRTAREKAARDQPLNRPGAGALPR